MLLPLLVIVILIPIQPVISIIALAVALSLIFTDFNNEVDPSLKEKKLVCYCKKTGVPTALKKVGDWYYVGSNEFLLDRKRFERKYTESEYEYFLAKYKKSNKEL